MGFMVSIEVQNRILQYNPWLTQPDQADSFIRCCLPETYVLRDAEAATLQKDRALLIVGPRQSGKSTLAWRLLRSSAPDILYLNLEDPLLRSAPGAAIELFSLLRERYAFIRAVFLDEAQHLADAGIFVKGLVDARLNIPVLVTGSSSFRPVVAPAHRHPSASVVPFPLCAFSSRQTPASGYVSCLAVVFPEQRAAHIGCLVGLKKEK